MEACLARADARCSSGARIAGASPQPALVVLLTGLPGRRTTSRMPPTATAIIARMTPRFAGDPLCPAFPGQRNGSCTRLLRSSTTTAVIAFVLPAVAGEATGPADAAACRLVQVGREAIGVVERDRAEVAVPLPGRRWNGISDARFTPSDVAYPVTSQAGGGRVPPMG